MLVSLARWQVTPRFYEYPQRLSEVRVRTVHLTSTICNDFDSRCVVACVASKIKIGRPASGSAVRIHTHEISIQQYECDLDGTTAVLRVRVLCRTISLTRVTVRLYQQVSAGNSYVQVLLFDAVERSVVQPSVCNAILVSCGARLAEPATCQISQHNFILPGTWYFSLQSTWYSIPVLRGRLTTMALPEIRHIMTTSSGSGLTVFGSRLPPVCVGSMCPPDRC